jgi:hypothetical protein
MGLINICVFLIELTFVVHLKMIFLKFLVCSNVLISSCLHLFNICNVFKHICGFLKNKYQSNFLQHLIILGL